MLSLYLGFHSPSLLFHPVVPSTCLWQQHREVAALPASGPKPSGSKEQRAAPGLTCGPNFSLFSKKCIHSACLGPKTLVITGLKWGPLRRNMRAAHLSQALPSLTPKPLWFPVFCPRDEPGWAFPGSSWHELAEVALPGAFHILDLLPSASCQSSPVRCHATWGSVLELECSRHLLALPRPTKGQAALTCPSCAWLACSQVLSGYPNISHPQNFPSSASFLVPFGFVGRGIVSGDVPAAWGRRERLDNVPVF